jgi:hypothetical protein
MKSRVFTSEMMTGGNVGAPEVPSRSFSFGTPGFFVSVIPAAAHRITLLHGLAVILLTVAE